MARLFLDRGANTFQIIQERLKRKANFEMKASITIPV